MRETVEATGFVLRADPQGEYDKRLVILTRELGKITVFARGARRPASSWLAACNTFVYATFSLYEGRSAYTLQGVSDAVYFDTIPKTGDGVYYGYYFLELASWYGQENLEASEMVNLLYVTLRAILKEKVPLKLIRVIYECRIMALNGDLAEPDNFLMDEAAKYAVGFVMQSPLSRLYSFGLSDSAFEDFRSYVEKRLTEISGGRFKTLSVLRMIDVTDFTDYNRKDE